MNTTLLTDRLGESELCFCYNTVVPNCVGYRSALHLRSVPRFRVLAQLCRI